MTGSSRWRTTLTVVALAACYVAVARLGTLFGTIYDGYAPFWPAAGFASGAVAVLGFRYAGAIALGSLVGSLPHYSVAATCWFMAVDAGEALLVASLIRRSGIQFHLGRPRDVVRLAMAGLAGGLASAALSGPVYATVVSPGASVAAIWAGWTIGNAIGHLTVGGTVLVWSLSGRGEPRRAALAERVAIAGVTVAVAAWVFLGPAPVAVAHAYLVLALVTWIAVRLGQRAVGVALLGVSGLAAWAVTRGSGPFAPTDGPALQAFLGVCALAGFGVAAVAAEREQAAGLREREDRYRTLADASPNHMWIGGGDGSIEFFNAQAQVYTGVAAPGRGWIALVHPDDRDAVTRAWTAAAGRPRPIGLELRLRRRDGAYRWHWAVNVPLAEEPGREPRWVGTATDIHDRKLAEIELASWRTHYERAQAIGQLGSWESSLETSGGPLVWSSELFRIFGVDPAHFDGRIDTFYTLVHSDDRARVRQAAAEAIERGSRYSVDHRIVRPDGEVRWVHEEADITAAADGSRRMVGVCRDITERIRAEEERRALEASLLQAQKLESLGILAGGIAHDFNNLLVGILGNASLALLDLPHDSPARGSLQRIETSSLRAADLVRQMLAYSGKATLTIERVDASVLVREMGDLLATAISRRAVLRYDLAAALPAVEADPTQLRQVVMNLITNASDALGDAGGTIAISTALVRVAETEPGAAGMTVPAGTYVEIQIADTGVGMDDATAARIFDPFFSTKFTGRGLGLAAVQGIVRSHRGTIRLRTSPGEGTTFTIMLPAAAGAASTAAPGGRPAAPPPPRLSGTALVIDDEEGVRQAIVLMLRRTGLDVLAASGGRDGIDQFGRHIDAITLVVLDLTMPDMGGAEVLAALRRRAPHLPVIVVSGYTRADAASAVGSDAAVFFLQKPFRPQELSDAIRAVLSVHGAVARGFSPARHGQG